jgi:hypothetical protein
MKALVTYILLLALAACIRALIAALLWISRITLPIANGIRRLAPTSHGLNTEGLSAEGSSGEAGAQQPRH